MHTSDDTSPPPAGTDAGYMAFISYSHSDNRDDGRKWADWLHQALETYEVPADLVGRPNQAGQPVPRQIYPVFQDEKELSASADLSTALRSALARSQHLVFLSSPRSATSPYVLQELRYFKQLGRGERITALILAGEPKHGERQTPLQCFPEVLRYRVDAEGNIDTTRPEEPLAADVRLPGGPEQGFTTPEAYRRFLLARGQTGKREIEAAVRQYRQRLELAKLKIIAGILQVPLGELTKRDQAYQLEKMRRKNRIIKAVATVISLLAIAAALAGLVAWNQRDQARSMLARSLYLSGIGRLQQGQLGDSAAYMAAATRLGGQAAAMFGQSLMLQNWTDTPLPQLGSGAIFSDDARLLAGVSTTSNSSEQIILWDVARKKPLRSVSVPGVGKMVTIRFDGLQRLWILTERGDIYRLAGDAAPELIRPNGKGFLYSDLQVNKDGSWLALQRQEERNGAWGESQLVLLPVTKDGHTEFPLPPLSMEPLAHDGILFTPGAAVQYSRDRLTHSTRLAVHPLQENTPGPAHRSHVDLVLPHLTASDTSPHLLLWDGSAAYLLHLQTDSAPRQLPAAERILQAAFNPDGKTLSLVHARGISLFDADTAEPIDPAAPGVDPLLVESVLNRGDNTAADGMHSIHLVRGQAVLRSSSVPSFVETQLHLGAGVAQVHAGRDRHHLFLKRRQASSIERWHLPSGEREALFVRTDAPIEHWGLLKRAGLLFTVSPEKELRFYRTEDGTMVGKAIQLAGTNFGTDRSEGRIIARKDERSLGIWEIAGGTLQASLPLAGGQAKFLSAPDFRQILWLHPDGSWHIDSMEDGTLLHRGSGDLLSARFTDDSRLFLAFGSGSAEVFDTRGYHHLFSIPSTGENPTGDISPDGEMIALADSTNQVRLWHMGRQQPVGQPIPFDPTSRFFRFSADGKRVITTHQAPQSLDTGVLFYDSASGLPLSMPVALSRRTDRLLLPADESRLITLTLSPENSMATVWFTPDAGMPPPAELAKDLEQFYGRTYLPETGAINPVAAANEAPGGWYFQNPYTRTQHPHSTHSLSDYLKDHIPIRSEADLHILVALWREHPLARAAMAEYYSRHPASAFLAQALAGMTRLQLANLPKGSCPALCQELLAQSAANLNRQSTP